jgi:hypothetical protein
VLRSAGISFQHTHVIAGLTGNPVTPVMRNRERRQLLDARVRGHDTDKIVMAGRRS